MNNEKTFQVPDILATFSVVTKSKGVLTKLIRKDPETGTAVKDGSQCLMYSGVIRRKNIRTFQQLGDGLRRLLADKAGAS